MSQPIVQVWSPADYHTALERAVNICPAVLSMSGEVFDCDNTAPRHVTHTSAALKARWIDEAL